MICKCKICGGETTVDTQSGIVICDYCGTKQAVPLFTEDSERLLYESGNNYLAHSEYDKAENVFNQLLTIKPNAAELYWDLVLCKYGVTYVQDPATGKYIPTCNRTHYTPIYADENYKKAIDLSSGEKKALFEADAATIDNIQRGIIAVSKKEKPFDIFISYKETDTSGNRTKDSVKAQKLYEKLTEAGYKVFFSRITLEDKVGTEYEPYIYAALYSSKVMLTVSSSCENLEAVWVKNEWSRFLGFRQNDNTKTLLPLYFDMDKADLPEEFALLSAYDMSVDGFEDELLRGIKKLIPMSITKAERKKIATKVVAFSLAFLLVVAGIVAAIIIPKKLEEKRIAEEKAAIEAAYQSAVALFDNRDYTAAEEALIALGDYKDAAQLAARCPIQPEYDAAMQLYYDGKYAQAFWAFEKLGDYEDAATQKEKAKMSWQKSLATPISYGTINRVRNRYYVTANGVLANATSGQEVYKNAEHGKVISVVDKFVLHEDSTVNPNEEGQNWQDIVQIAKEDPWVGSFALKTDGTVLTNFLKGDSYYDRWQKGYKQVADWKNLVAISADGFCDEGMYGSALAGLDADGNVFVYAQFSGLGPTDKVVKKLPKEFTNIKAIDIACGDNNLNAIALTNDGKLITYINGKTSVKDAADVVDISVDWNTFYTISAEGKLYKDGKKTPLLNDAVNVIDSYTVTRSGTIYDAYYAGEEKGCKTTVYDEWLAKMG